MKLDIISSSIILINFLNRGFEKTVNRWCEEFRVHWRRGD